MVNEEKRVIGDKKIPHKSKQEARYVIDM